MAVYFVRGEIRNDVCWVKFSLMHWIITMQMCDGIE